MLESNNKHDPRKRRNHKIYKIPLTHVEKMQNQIMPKQPARATKEETRKREDQIKNGDKA
jgi:hypothetical protein